MNKYELYMGRRTRDGRLLERGSFEQFKQDVIENRLLAFTILSGEGYFNGIPEPTFILTLVSPPQVEPTLREIGRLYARRFHQDSVFLTASPVATTALIAADEPVLAFPKLEGTLAPFGDLQ